MAKVVEVIPSESIRIQPGRRLPTLRLLLAASASVAFLASLMGPADAAQRGYGYFNPYYGFTSPYGTSAPRRARQATTPSTGKAEPKKDVGFGELPKGPLQIVVSIGSQRVTLYANGERVAQGPVSTGVPGHPTPLGVFSVIEKDRHHHSNIYSGAPMPFMQRITWSGIALHEGALPGHPASHGCIRLSHDFAQKLWPTTKLGVRVIVARNDLSPSDFAHPKLFVPKAKPAVEPVAHLDRPVRLAQNEVPPSDGATATDAQPVEPAAPTAATEETRPADAAKPTEATAPAAADATETAATPADDTQATDRAAADAPAEPTGTLPATQPAEVPSLELRRAVEAPQPVEAPKPAETPKSAEAPQTAEAPKSVEAPKPAEPTVAAPAATEPEKPAPGLTDPAKPVTPRIKNADQPQKRTGQVAVFVSRKEKKIFVRQGFAPIFEMPITIDQPENPLGTHVFTAMGVTDGGTGMRWNLITVPNDVSRPEPTRESRRRGQREPVVQAPVSHRAPSTAAEALDRIQFPQEAIDRISDILTPGSSLVVSDEGLGRETGRGTEFVVLTR